MAPKGDLSFLSPWGNCSTPNEHREEPGLFLGVRTLQYLPEGSTILSICSDVGKARRGGFLELLLASPVGSS